MKKLKICYQIDLGIGINLVLGVTAFSLLCNAVMKYSDWSLKKQENNTKES